MVVIIPYLLRRAKQTRRKRKITWPASPFWCNYSCWGLPLSLAMFCVATRSWLSTRQGLLFFLVSHCTVGTIICFLMCIELSRWLFFQRYYLLCGQVRGQFYNLFWLFNLQKRLFWDIVNFLDEIGSSIIDLGQINGCTSVSTRWLLRWPYLSFCRCACWNVCED